MFVSTAVNLFRAIMRIANTALGIVMPMPDGRRSIAMDEKLFNTILLYKTTMSKVKQMLKRGLISSEEYAEIDTIIAKKYGLNSSVIYR